jgi:hypothetical protein
MSHEIDELLILDLDDVTAGLRQVPEASITPSIPIPPPEPVRPGDFL